VDAAPSSLILEIVGYEDTVERFIRMLEPYRILEMQRTGVVGMLRGWTSFWRFGGTRRATIAEK